MNLRRLYQNPYFLPALVAITYVLLILDTIKYPGFVAKHLFIDAKLFLVASVTAVFVLGLPDRTRKIINSLNVVISSVIGISYIFFSVQESLHYTNYVFSKFHFNFWGLIYILLFSILLIAVGHLKNIREPKFNKNNFGKIIIYFLLFYTLVVNFGITFKNALENDIYVFLHLSNNYDQKMFHQWGNYYNYMKFVKDNTPENATIIIPPQTNPWLSSGNILLDRYFLFPRNLVQTGLVIDDPDKLFKGAYVMIYKGEWCNSRDCEIWPTQTIKASELITKDPNSSSVQKTIKNYIYNPAIKEYPFGLLKI